MDRGVMYYFLYAMRMHSFQPMARYDEKKRAVFDIKSSKDELSKTERGENGFGKSGLM